jgi:hypothetical protein
MLTNMVDNVELIERDEAGNITATYIESASTHGASRVDVVVRTHFTPTNTLKHQRCVTDSYDTVTQSDEEPCAANSRCLPSRGLPTERYRGLHTVCQLNITRPSTSGCGAVSDATRSSGMSSSFVDET